MHEIPPAVRALLEAGHRSPSADNCQPWHFRWDGDVVTVFYDSQRVRGQTFGPEEHATLLTMGAVRENLLQMAGWLGLAPRLTPTSHNEDPPTYIRIKLKTDRSLKPEAGQHPLFQRHTNRFSHRQTALDAEVLQTVQMMSERNCRILTFSDDDSINKAAGWVRVASEARFQTKELHELLGRSLRFSPAESRRGDGLDVRTLSLPPGGRLFLRLIRAWSMLNFLNRFRLYKFLARVEAHQLLNCSAVVAVVGPSTREDILDAGALMERAWIYLNSRGMAVQPYYVVTDQIERLKSRKVPPRLASYVASLRSGVAEFLNSGESILHILIRVGYPHTSPTRSMRLPLETVITWTGK